jgi:hypothetical protein
MYLAARGRARSERASVLRILGGDVMARRFRHHALVVLALLAGLAAVPASARNPPKCGFHPVDFRTIDARHGISCAEAKRVLRALKGDRDTIPMVCGRPRIIHGWHVRNSTRGYSATFNRYSRGHVSFRYQRMQNPWRQWCPPIGDDGADV